MMYIHLMVRTQLYLDEALHARLRDLARKRGRTVSQLVRDALIRAYGSTTIEEQVAAIKGIEGLWRKRDDIGDPGEYVRQLRRDTHRLPKGGG